MIEELNKKDINQVMDIWLKENKNTHYYISEQYWNNHFKKVKQEILKSEVYVYKEKEEIYGFIGLSGTYIAGIFVKKEKQAMGIGKKLIQFCKSKHAELMLHVYVKNEKAIRFYKKQQFNIIQEEIDKATNEKEYVMKWVKYSESI